MVDYSEGAQTSLKCPECGLENPLMVWAVVDVEAAPELFESAIQCKINSIRCASCGHAVHSANAIVLYRAGSDRPFIITSDDLALPESEGSIAFYFMFELAGRLGYDKSWLTNYVNSGLPIIPRVHLAKTFSVRKPTPALIKRVATLVSTRAWIELVDLITEDAELISAEAEELLDRMAGSLWHEGRTEDAEIWERRRDFIHTVRSVGLAQAILDVTGMSIEQLREESLSGSTDTQESNPDGRG